MSGAAPRTRTVVVALLRKELRVELRTWESVPAMTLFSVTAYVLFHFGLQRNSLEGSLASGVPAGIQPVNVWFGYLSPKLMKAFPCLLTKTTATTPETVIFSLTWFTASAGSIWCASAERRRPVESAKTRNNSRERIASLRLIPWKVELKPCLVSGCSGLGGYS